MIDPFHFHEHLLPFIDHFCFLNLKISKKYLPNSLLEPSSLWIRPRLTIILNFKSKFDELSRNFLIREFAHSTTIFLCISLNNTIFLLGLRTSGLVDNVTIRTKGTKRGLDKLKSIIDMKNLRCSGILSDNLRDEVGDRSDNLKVVAEKVDPTHMSVIIKNIITMN